MAAGILRISYEGLAMNPAHAIWLDHILDTAMFTIVMDYAKDEEAMKLKASVNQYFNSYVTEGRVFLAKTVVPVEDEVDDEVDDETDAENED